MKKHFLFLLFTVVNLMAAEFVDIKIINPNIVVDLKYATTDNFTGEVVYTFEKCLLLKTVACELSAIQNELEPLGLGLKIWDGYRPIAAQVKFWELFPDERYVSDPRKGGRHTRGTTVDVTLIDGRGNELLMPTAFDDFSEKAHLSYRGEDVPKEAIKNREFLRKTMESHGFTGVQTEWWHYDISNWQDFPPVDFDVSSFGLAR